MPLTPVSAVEVLRRLDDYDAVIDARSEGEYADDRLPGALNWPSLTDTERVDIGTRYKQDSAFAAKKRGAALIARNIAAHIERDVLSLQKDWKPLVYCWRGGKRSGALAHVLAEIGFRVEVLDGGYREFRRAVVAALEVMPQHLDLRVVCGPTGSGKSLLLHALEAQGAQVLDLEALANHRGSVLGLVPGSTQPTQKRFDTLLWDAMRRLDPSRPVFVESESKKIGDLRVPEVLIQRMRASPCLWLELGLERRVGLLIEEYAFFVADTAAFCARLDALRVLRGNEVIDAWQESARAGRTAQVVRELLLVHYDPIYLQSMRRNFAGVAAPWMRLEWDGSAKSLTAVAGLAIAAPRP